MKNVHVEEEGNIIRLTIDLSKTQGLSKSGKSTIIATTSGNKQLVPGVFMGLNIYKK